MTPEEIKEKIQSLGYRGSIERVYGKEQFLLPFVDTENLTEVIKEVEDETDLKLSTVYLEFKIKEED